jgi:hypothetical protein
MDWGTFMQHDHMHTGMSMGDFIDITEYGSFHDSNSNSHGHDLHGGRTAITTEALVAWNALRGYLGLAATDIETVGRWAFANRLTNNTQAWGDDLKGVGLYYAMQGAKTGWIRDEAFDPQILADIQRTARLGDPADVMAMVEEHGHRGFHDYLVESGLAEHFVNTLKMEPHYGGWMHGRVHGWLEVRDENGVQQAIVHDLNHLTVLSHDQLQPFMNDTFDWPQWPALNVAHQDVIDYFQSMVVLGDPLGDALPTGTVGVRAFTNGDDTWDGTIADNTVHGRGGDDSMNGHGGDDMLHGGSGDDRLIGHTGNDRLRGGAGDDAIFGGSGRDDLRGGDGDDVLRGGGGDDVLAGDGGNDILIGGGGADRFVFALDGGRDVVKDFQDNVDTLVLDEALWSGTLTARQVVNRFARETDDAVLFVFDGGERVRVEGVTDAMRLVNDIEVF